MKYLTISGGTFKGSYIVCPPKNIRPVMAKVRESIFQIIHNYIATHLNIQDLDIPLSSLSFLDLFTGSGLMAIEAISQGMRLAVGVEIDRHKWPIISRNFLIAKHQLFLVKSSAELYLLKNTHGFNIIYIDPPFNYKYKEDVLHKLDKSKSIKPHSLIMIHTPTKEALPKNFLHLHYIDEKTYGGSTIKIYTATLP